MSLEGRSRWRSLTTESSHYPRVVAQRLSIPRLTGLAAVYGRGFAATRFRAMELITILNCCHRFRGFYHSLGKLPEPESTHEFF